MNTPLKIVYIVPGSGNTFYCENCLRDCAAVKALGNRGHDVVMVPLYLPLFADEEDLQQQTQVFFGGVNVYLQQKFRLFRKTPRWLDRLLDSRFVLNLAAGRAGSTRAYGMGEMTLSMLRGMEGNQMKEVERLAGWLVDLKPDIIHFSNALLLGMAPELKRTLPETRMICSLQDEDTWIDRLEPPFDQTCLAKMGELLGLCEGIVCVSDSYRREMGPRLNFSPEQLAIIEPGLDASAYKPVSPSGSPRRIGYLSRVSESLGAEILADAFIRLAGQDAFADLELIYGGGTTDDDKRFLKKLKKKFARAGVRDRVAFLPGLKLSERLDLLSGLTVLSVPMPDGEAFGTFILESLFMGIPVVQPDVGGFGNILRQTGGGLLYTPDSINEPRASIELLLRDLPRCKDLGARGRQAAIQHYSAEREARELEELYMTHLKKYNS